ncbi:RidA family protein [Pseudonocardia acidicola]|uniref:RidA family protein n=1 Tax=Pseudonocardia acidicola TaxID=2724939 RepID=A0ABX1S6I3_9PSEU|nr:RidA family protein [Pseudonocardia acidicola]NMH95743.1 RidA family protein [Pseudonocardia acidicola]
MPYTASAHSTGTYRYLPAIAPYSSGVAAEPGYEIIGLRFDVPPPVVDGFVRLDDECARRGLPPSALVGIELRSPAPFAFGAFDEFNETYRQLLAERGLLQDGVNPIARTNVVPVRSAPAQPVLLSAFLVQPAAGAGGVDFVVAGGGEIDGLDPDAIVARGDISEAGLTAKAGHVIDEMRARLAGLGKDPQSPTLVNVYTAHETAGLSEMLLDRLPAVARHGFVRWLTRPPVVEVEFEMDLRRVSGWHAL